MDLESTNEIDSTRRRRRQRRRRRYRQTVMSGFDPTVTGDSLDECRFPEIERNVISTHITRDAAAAATSSTGGCLSDVDVDLESGELEMVKGDRPLGGNKEERDCRICHLKSGEELSGIRREGDEDHEVVIDLGCSCKGDLGSAHKHCAETWFKIRGNTTCEVCGSAATNVVAVVVGIIINDEAAAAAAVSGGIGTTTSSSSSSSAAAAGVVVVPVGPPVMVIAENGISWNGRRLVNILLASMILAFVISWLFHSKVLSS